MSVRITEALIELSNNKLKEAFETIPPDLLEKDVEELEDLAKPTKKMKALKLRFQDVMHKCIIEKRLLTMAEICKNIYHVSGFQRNILPNPHMMAWLIVPDVEVALQMQVLGDKALSKLEEMIDLPVNAKTAKTILTAAKMILDRTQPLVTRTENKTMQLKADLTPKTEEEKLQRLEELRKKLIGTTTHIEAIDVENT